MPKLNFSLPNPLGKDDAMRRLQHFTDAVKRKYGDQVSDLSETWHDSHVDFGFKTFGMGVKGAIEVSDENVQVAVDLPLAAAMFKGKIENEIRNSIQTVLGPSA